MLRLAIRSIAYEYIRPGREDFVTQIRFRIILGIARRKHRSKHGYDKVMLGFGVS